MWTYYIIIGAIALVSWLVSNKLKSKFAFYSKVTLRNGMSGAEIAEKMLQDHGITDVKVISTPGQLTDHYNPANKTVNLSEAVYNQRNAAAAAVAAHECGHAVQHAHAYEWLTMRSKMVPVVNISSSIQSGFVFIWLSPCSEYPALLINDGKSIVEDPSISLLNLSICIIVCDTSVSMSYVT